MVVIRGWAFVLFLGAADMVMILRVWAMYSRSRLILVSLLVLFFLQMVSVVLTAAVQSDPRNLTAATFQILDFSVCIVDPTSFTWAKVNSILQITNGAVLCTLAVFQFVRQSVEMYNVTKEWQLNRYMGLLVREGILYFFAIFMFNLVNELAAAKKLQNSGWQLIVTVIIQYVPVFTLTPRFIMSLRELHMRDVEGRRGNGIDSGFGLSSGSRTAVTVRSEVFAGFRDDATLEDVEMVPRKVETTKSM
ncbi:hypothetical protein L210DRAFT_3759725 [Boletus edulis BED1]|uniref:Uncharacterized protein n=1 Tax=Boletus edulis BED1 TaxID=1328754 RepID=A0AAD4BXW3_BOLED|nr:hypothetical protein L210DRAFT_3759725 [Boletus edulis BED1]